MLPSEEYAKADSQSGIYEARYQIKTGDFVVDLGANVGYWTEIACGKADLVFAVEPFRQNFDLLRERVANWRNVLCINAAAGEMYGERDFYEHVLNCGGHSLYHGCEYHKPHNKVSAINIGHFLSLFKRTPAFIKIDTESAEIEIVSSLIKHGMHLCHMAIECHDANCYASVRDMLVPTHHFHPEKETIGVCYATPK